MVVRARATVIFCDEWKLPRSAGWLQSCGHGAQSFEAAEQCIIPAVKSSQGANSSMGATEPAGRIRNIFTDVHFWVPTAVLLGGLLLLRFLH